MHLQALEWIRAHATTEEVAVLDLGGRNVNGTPRRLFPAAAPYRVLDIADGPGVDIVADAATWEPDRVYDVVVCAEVLEHTPAWRDILATAHRAAREGSRLILTTAAPGRPVHSGIDGRPQLHPGEHYANIEPAELLTALQAAGWRQVVIDVRHHPNDVRATAVR
ncbi:methyltransferase domain-containing protein [Streptomyces sp. NPDC048386]|uniref:methyltransferase domain-containing protein n=1 Tax=Streptomyces sp. NPDC048386 TaxID=3365541 RepID=UPI0037173676